MCLCIFIYCLLFLVLLILFLTSIWLITLTFLLALCFYIFQSDAGDKPLKLLPWNSRLWYWWAVKCVGVLISGEWRGRRNYAALYHILHKFTFFFFFLLHFFRAGWRTEAGRQELISQASACKSLSLTKQSRDNLWTSDVLICVLKVFLCMFLFVSQVFLWAAVSQTWHHEFQKCINVHNRQTSRS